MVCRAIGLQDSVETVVASHRGRVAMAALPGLTGGVFLKQLKAATSPQGQLHLVAYMNGRFSECHNDAHCLGNFKKDLDRLKKVLPKLTGLVRECKKEHRPSKRRKVAQVSPEVEEVEAGHGEGAEEPEDLEEGAYGFGEIFVDHLGMGLVEPHFKLLEDHLKSNAEASLVAASLDFLATKKILASFADRCQNATREIKKKGASKTAGLTLLDLSASLLNDKLKRGLLDLRGDPERNLSALRNNDFLSLETLTQLANSLHTMIENFGIELMDVVSTNSANLKCKKEVEGLIGDVLRTARIWWADDLTANDKLRASEFIEEVRRQVTVALLRHFFIFTEENQDAGIIDTNEVAWKQFAQLLSKLCSFVHQLPRLDGPIPHLEGDYLVLFLQRLCSAAETFNVLAWISNSFRPFLDIANEVLQDLDASASSQTGQALATLPSNFHAAMLERFCQTFGNEKLSTLSSVMHIELLTSCYSVIMSGIELTKWTADHQEEFKRAVIQGFQEAVQEGVGHNHEGPKLRSFVLRSIKQRASSLLENYQPPANADVLVISDDEADRQEPGSTAGLQNAATVLAAIGTEAVGAGANAQTPLSDPSTVSPELGAGAAGADDAGRPSVPAAVIPGSVLDLAEQPTEKAEAEVLPDFAPGSVIDAAEQPAENADAVATPASAAGLPNSVISLAETATENVSVEKLESPVVAAAAGAGHDGEVLPTAVAPSPVAF